ncbi:MAG: AsmA family protein, partial [Alphaproteobacteria bacterium]|nr:AsmA family protein [Alphaproteobacteria bacterium]
RINGPISFRMLPRPALSLENATIANRPGAAEPLMLSLECLDAQLGMLALLSGKIQVTNFRLIAPVLNLETLAGGVNNWDFLEDSKDNAPGIRFDHVSIERGQMRYRNPSRGNVVEASQMALQLTGESLHGPFTIIGSMQLQQVPVQFDATIGNNTAGHGGSLILKTELPGHTAIDFNGSITPEAEITGTLKSRGADFASLMNSLTQLGLPSPTVLQSAFLRHPYQVEGSLAVTASRLKYDLVKINLNENMLTGSFSLHTVTPAMEATLNTSSLDLDKLLSADTSNTPAPQAQAGDTGPVSAMAGTMRFTANVIKFRQGAVRDVTLTASLSDGVMTLEDFSAHFPGSSTAHISGRLTYGQDRPDFSGRLDTQAQNLRGLLIWLGIEIPDMPERSLSRAQLSAQLDMSPGFVQLNEILGELDSSRLKGGLSLTLRERIALGIDMQIDQLSLDNYFPPDSVASIENAPPDKAAPWPFLEGLTKIYDSHFKLSIDGLTTHGVPMNKLRTDGSVINGTLALSSFTVADMAGTAISLNGTLNNLPAAPEGQVNLRLASNDLGGLGRAIGLTLPVPGSQLGKSSIDAKFQIAGSTVQGEIDATFQATAIRITGETNSLSPGSIPPADTAPTSRMRISITNPSLRNIAAQAGFTIDPAKIEEDAGLALSAEVSGANREIIVSAVNGAIGTIPVPGQASWNYQGPKPVLRLEAHVGEILADNLFQAGLPSGTARPGATRQLPWSGAPLDLTFMDRFDADVRLDAARYSGGGYDFVKPALMFELREGTASVKQFTGLLFGGEASATASLHKTGAALELKAEWNLKAADMQAAAMALSGTPAITGRLDLSGAVTGVGASSFALVSSLEGKAVLTASNGLIQGMDLPGFSAQLAHLDRATDFLKLADNVLQAGNTPYKRINAPFTIKQGVAQSDNPEISIAGATGGWR